MIRHAIPYAAASAACRCPVQKCGGIIPDPDCPDHGTRKSPVMEWHHDDGSLCRELRPEPRYRCDRGHALPASFTPVGDPEDWDDTCRCEPKS